MNELDEEMSVDRRNRDEFNLSAPDT